MSTSTATTTLNPLSPSGSFWPNISANVSNGLSSSVIASGITNFTIFNPFVHYLPPNIDGSAPIKIITSGLLQVSTSRFELYSAANRSSGPSTFTTTTATPPPGFSNPIAKFPIV